MDRPGETQPDAEEEHEGLEGSADTQELFATWGDAENEPYNQKAENEPQAAQPVSYTHLTLPTNTVTC